MKKIFFVAMAAVAFASCSKNTDINNPETDTTDGPQVQLTFGTDAQTRAFFDRSATPEPWESEIEELTIYAFDSSGKIIIRRALTASEISAKSVNFLLPNSAAGTDCSFYALANYTYPPVSSVGQMEALEEPALIQSYNSGTFDMVSGGHMIAKGFMMTGKTTAKIATTDSSTKISIPLKRTVAKVAIQAKTDPSFTQTYGKGKVVINSAKLSNVRQESYTIFTGRYLSNMQLKEMNQVPQTVGDKTNCLFYIYENRELPEGNRVLLTLSGYFDADGDDSTTTDRANVEYKVELTGSGNGEIKRNAYYRVEVLIKGLSGDGLGVNISVADWETPVTQTAGVGN
jgi:hypothetical protein